MDGEEKHYADVSGVVRLDSAATLDNGCGRLVLALLASHQMSCDTSLFFLKKFVSFYGRSVVFTFKSI